MSSRLKALCLSAAILVAAASCKKETYVELTVAQGMAPAGEVASIEVQLGLGSASATTTLTEKGGGTVAFPTTVLLQIRNGEGTLSIVAIAKDAAGQELVRGTGTVVVKRNSTAKTTVTLGQATVIPDMTTSSTDLLATDLTGVTGDLTGADLTGATDDMVSPGAAVLTLSDTSKSFGSVVVGQTGTSSTITLQNTGTDPSGTVTLTSSGAPFAVIEDACTGNSLAPTDTCTFKVTFTPATAVTSAGTITVSAVSATSVTVDLTGAGLQPGNLTLDKHTKDFGPVVVNGSTTAEVFTLTNSGGVPSANVTVLLQGNNSTSYKLSNDLCSGLPVAAGGSCTVGVIFNPKSLGLKDGVTLTLSDSASGDSAALSGSGVTAGALAFTGDPAFGIVDLTASLMRDYTITNTGGSSIGPLVVSSTNNTEFAASMSAPTCAGKTLLAGDSCTQRVTFAPSSYGSRSSSLSVAPSSGLGGVTQALTGTGRDQVTLNLTFAGTGTVTLPAAGSVTATALSCTTNCSKVYYRTSASTSVSLSATPSGSSTTSWSVGTCSGNACAVLLDSSPKAVTVTFTAPQYNLTINTSQFPSGTTAGGTVTFASTTCNTATPCTTKTVALDAATPVSITVSADASSEFVRFISAGTNSCPTTLGPTVPTCSFNLGGATTISVVFRPKKNLMFVTSGTFSVTSLANSATDLSPADTDCQNAAAAANLTGGAAYVAWLSTSSVNATARLSGYTGWLRTDGKPFGQLPTDFATGSSPAPSGQVFYPPSLDENGTSSGTDTVATGTFGGNYLSGYNCGDFKAGGGSLYSGSRLSTTAGWSYESAGTCVTGQQVRIYCFEKRFASTVTPPAPAQKRVVFMSDVTWSPAGLASADLLCNNEGRALPGMTTSNNFVALLSTGAAAATAATRVTAAGANWYRLDNVMVADTTTAFLAGNWLTTINRTPSEYVRNFYVWTGSTAPNLASSAGATPCGTNWDVTTGNGYVGFSNSTTYMWNNSPAACNSPNRIYCIQNN